MKRWIFSLIFGIALATPAKAQRNNQNIESIRVAFITQKLDLTPEESQKFWPVYNSYREEARRIAVKRAQQRRALKHQPGTAAPVDELQLESEMLELKKRYRVEFARVLPKQKAALVYPAEREFMQQLIEHLPKRKKKN